MPPSALPARLRAKQVLFNEENTPFDITLPLAAAKRKEITIMSTNIQLLSAIRPSDIPAEYADLVEVLGLDGFLTLVDLCGGQSLYIPKGETLRRDGRDREIRARFTGGNYRALASQFRLSERQIRKIVNGTRV